MKILMIGHFGGRNIGDELILLSQMQLFQKKYPNVEFLVFTYDEEFTQKTYRKYGYKVSTVKAFGLRKSLSSVYDQISKIKDIDFAILGGGGLIQDIYFSYGTFRYLLPVYICLLRDIPVYTFALGVYRFKYKFNKILFKDFLLNAHGVSVRDEISVKNIQALGTNTFVEQIPDSALAFDIDQYVDLNTETDESRTLTLVFREFFEPYLIEIKTLLVNLVKKYNVSRLNIIVFENNPVEQDLAEKMKEALKVENLNIYIFNTIDPVQYLLLLKQSQLVVSGRLHGILPSVLLKKDLICLSYAPKIESYCKEQGFKYLTFDDLNRIDHINVDHFIVNMTGNDKNQSTDIYKTERYLNTINVTKYLKVRLSSIKKLQMLLNLSLMGVYLLIIHIVNKLTKQKVSSE